ncbi:MAG: hypothetical protein ACE37B_22770 [Ilumatobacter sp.]|jgi:hypothetical protein|uniref:hypothetical protein n=1 Tax=Ilumatobacter sp. TaxID=1967498 RepID=UPI00391CCA22
MGLRDSVKVATDWLLGRDEPKPPDPDKTVEAGWVPQWQSQMICDLLNAEGVPAVVTDDYGLNPMMTTREPMARIFVTEDRKAEAEEIIGDFLGHPPRHRGL